MISEKMQEAINDQINAEIYSAYLYLAIENFFHQQNLEGFANWMRIQAQEELTHAMKLYDHLIERGGTGKFETIKKPDIEKEVESPAQAFSKVSNHERYVTNRINFLVDLAIEEKDHASKNFLQWFVNEQVEEEATADAIFKKVRHLEDSPGGLYLMDTELAKRTFIPPTAEE